MTERVRRLIAAELQDCSPPQGVLTKADAILAALEAEGLAVVPVEATNEIADRFCALRNEHPDGTQFTVRDDGPHVVTLRDLAKGDYRAAIAAAKEKSHDDG